MSYPRLSQHSYQSPIQLYYDILVNVIPRLLHSYQNCTKGCRFALVKILTNVVRASISKPYQGCYYNHVKVCPENCHSQI